MRPLEWALLIQSDGCLYKKINFTHTKRHQGYTHRGRTMWGHHEKMTICKPRRERGLRRNQNCWYLDLELPSFMIVKNKFLFFKPPACGILLWQSWQTNTGGRQRSCPIRSQEGLTFSCSELVSFLSVWEHDGKGRASALECLLCIGSAINTLYTHV